MKIINNIGKILLLQYAIGPGSSKSIIIHQGSYDLNTEEVQGALYVHNLNEEGLEKLKKSWKKINGGHNFEEIK